LLGRRKYLEAIKVFEINTLNYPNSANVYDSLGEAYLKEGNTEIAAKNYQKAIELNPKNTNAAGILKRLQSQVEVDSNLLDLYAGDYQAPFGVLSFVKDKKRLVGLVSGEPDTIFLPRANTQFVDPIRGTQVTFVKNEKGAVTHIVILLNGREIQAKRIE
jgi:tetratricopeptide (TPR) repeat protein